MGKFTRRNMWGLIIGTFVSVLAIGVYAIAHNPDLIPGMPPTKDQQQKVEPTKEVPAKPDSKSQVSMKTLNGYKRIA